jgi:signal transduction histidine kinase
MDQNLIDVLEVAILSFFIIFMLSSTTIFVLFLYKKRQIENKNKLQLLELKFETNILKTNLEIQEETLHNIAREIHDNISLNLTLSKLYLNTLPQKEDDKNSELIQSSIDLISKSLYDLNNLSKSLDGEMIKRNGLLFSIENELENIKKLGSYNVEMDIHGNSYFLKPEIELLIFRITQETLKNSITHSYADNIAVSIRFEKEYLTISIRDDGKGFSIEGNLFYEEKRLSSGIASMKKRAELIDAEFTIESSNGNGTKTLLKIPTQHYDKR